MDIRYLSRRTHDYAARSGSSAAPLPAAEVAAVASGSGSPAADVSAPEPAASARLSGAGRLLHVLQSFEQRHPEQTKQILGNIADRLRGDAQHAGPFSARLQRWADRFQQAADTGDMSKLMPSQVSHGHFGLRAYQQAQQSAEPEQDMVAQAADAALSEAAASGSAAQVAAAPAEASEAGAPVDAQPRDSSIVEQRVDARLDSAQQADAGQQVA